MTVNGGGLQIGATTQPRVTHVRSVQPCLDSPAAAGLRVRHDAARAYDPADIARAQRLRRRRAEDGQARADHTGAADGGQRHRRA